MHRLWEYVVHWNAQPRVAATLLMACLFTTTLFASPREGPPENQRANSKAANSTTPPQPLVVGGFRAEEGLDPRDQWLLTALEETLAWRLRRVPALTVVPTTRAQQARQELADKDSDPPVEWARVAPLLGAKRWLRGSCAGSPNALTVELELLDANDLDANPVRARVGPGRLFDVLDEATRWALGRFGVARIDRTLEALIFAPPAKSPTALEYYAKAVSAARQGDVANGVYFVTQAVDYDRRFSPALMLLAKIELRSPAAIRARADLHLQQVEVLTEAAGDRVLTDLKLAQGLAALMNGSFDRTRECFEAALANADERNDPFGQIDAMTGLAEYWLNYRPPTPPERAEDELREQRKQWLRQAAQWQLRVLEKVREVGDVIAEPTAASKLALIYEQLEEPELALQAHRETLAAAERTGSPRSQATAWLVLGQWYRRQERWAEALEATQSCLALVAEEHKPTIHITLGEIQRGMANTKTALSHYETAYQSLASGTRLIDQFVCLRAIAELRMELGERAAAISKLQEALDIAHVKQLDDEQAVREQLEQWKSAGP